ncbi:MAG TPA: PAC2 family protein [Actinocrinis sp.]|nr:PAC2 family protein [Actinocrinis sp.]
MADPQDLYELDPTGLAALARARGRSGGAGDGDLALLYHFEGFMDAGQAAEQTVEHLLTAVPGFAVPDESGQWPGSSESAGPADGSGAGERLPGSAARAGSAQVRRSEPGQVVARFDADRLVDYRAQRPVMTFDTDHWAAYQAPELTVRLSFDATGTPFLVLFGPEPDTEWELFSRAVLHLVEELGISLSINFHGIPFGVPHTRPTTLIPHGNRPELLAGYPKWFDQAQVPGSAMALVEFRLAEAGHAVFGLAAQVPHYVSRSPYPAASVRILEAITAATGLVLPAGELRERADRIAADIASQVAAGDDELRSIIASLEAQFDAVAGPGARPNLLAEQAGTIPTADELARQFEAFLAEQDGSGPA